MSNPPAFPHSHLGIDRGKLSHEDSDYADGMTLRDYFAAKAMQGFCANPEMMSETTEQIAGWAFKQADGMLKARGAQ